MKKILFALGITIVCLCSCNALQKDDAIVTDCKVAVSEETKGAGMCVVDISLMSTQFDYEFKIDSIQLKNAKDSVLGLGYYIGSYSVPHNGTITLYWKDNNKREKWVRHKYKVKVGIANHLDLRMGTWSLYIGDVEVYDKRDKY